MVLILIDVTYYSGLDKSGCLILGTIIVAIVSVVVFSIFVVLELWMFAILIFGFGENFVFNFSQIEFQSSMSCVCFGGKEALLPVPAN